jgi:hypothetical protein
MTHVPARLALRIATVAFGLCVTGCVATRTAAPPQGAGTARTPTGESPPAPRTARETIVAGKSTRAEVVAGLGKAIVIRFDSGYEVWVYRWRNADQPPRAATELVVLFDPSGVATKARLRPGDETLPE